MQTTLASGGFPRPKTSPKKSCLVSKDVFLGLCETCMGNVSLQVGRSILVLDSRSRFLFESNCSNRSNQIDRIDRIVRIVRIESNSSERLEFLAGLGIGRHVQHVPHV